MTMQAYALSQTSAADGAICEYLLYGNVRICCSISKYVLRCMCIEEKGVLVLVCRIVFD
jgi:hypothetical protein